MRTVIQTKLNELDIECGEPIADNVVENNKTYFGYMISKVFLNSDLDKNYTYRVSITGHITRRKDVTENTTEIVDKATENIIEKLKELNFKCNSEDVSISNNIQKVRITGYADYNEINNKLIV